MAIGWTRERSRRDGIRWAAIEQFEPRVFLSGGGGLVTERIGGWGDYARQIEVEGGIAMVQSGDDSDSWLSLLDISDPELPREVGRVDPAEDVVDFELSGRYAYVADSGGLQIWDVGRPDDPVLTGTYRLTEPDDSIAAVSVGGSRVYLAGTHSLSITSTAQLLIIDASDPATPILAGSSWLGGSRAGRITVDGNYAYVDVAQNSLLSAPQSSVEIVDISDPSQPVMVGGMFLGNWYWAHDIEVRGIYAYVAGGSDGLQIWDIHDRQNPVQVSKVSALTSANGVSVVDRYAYVADGAGGLQIVDLADARQPVLVGSDAAYAASPSAQDVVVTEDGIFLADGGAGVVALRADRGLRAQAPVTYSDAAGNAVTVRLTGPGAGKIVRPLDGDHDPLAIELTGTTSQSALVISVAGRNGVTRVGSLDLGTGQLGLLNARGVSITDAGITGSEGAYIRDLRIGDLDNGADITLPGSAAKVRGRIAAGAVGGGSEMRFGLPLQQATFVSVGNGRLEAPAVARLRTAGSFDASLILYGMAGDSLTLGSATVGGIGSGAGVAWEVSGSVGQVRVSGSISGANIVVNASPGTVALAALQVRVHISSSTVRVSGDIGSIRAANIESSRFYCGYAGEGLPATAAELAETGRIGSIQISPSRWLTPDFSGNLIAAARIGRLSVLRKEGAEQSRIATRQLGQYRVVTMVDGRPEVEARRDYTGGWSDELVMVYVGS